MSFYDRFVGGHSRLVTFWRKDKVLFDKGIRFVGIEFVIGPSCGVVGDVICYFAQGSVIADDVFIIIALPQFAVEGRPSQLFHPTDVFVGHMVLNHPTTADNGDPDTFSIKSESFTSRRGAPACAPSFPQ